MLGYSGEWEEFNNDWIAASRSGLGGAGGPSKINCELGPSGGSTSRSGCDGDAFGLDSGIKSMFGSIFELGGLGDPSNTDCGLDAADRPPSNSGGVGDISGMKSSLGLMNGCLFKTGSLGGLLKMNRDLSSAICSISGSPFEPGSAGGPSKLKCPEAETGSPS